MSLEADIVLTRGELSLDAAVSVADGELVALLGPNGAGKTSVLRAITGLDPLERGRVAVDGTVLDDPGAGVFVPVEERPIGLVFQDYLLFPHLDVLDNVAFGLRSRGIGRADAREAARGWLERFNLSEVARRRPAQLSGGQAQRASLARALAPSPRVLLLDEPLAALDVATRSRVRREMLDHLDSFPGARVLVTHDPVEAVTLADRIIVLEEGTVRQVGTAAEIRRHPRSDYIARLVGVNLLRGRADGHDVALPGGARIHLAEPAPPGEVSVIVRPQSVALYPTRPDGTPRNVWLLTVRAVEGDTDRVRVDLDGPVPLTAEITPAAVTALGIAPGSEVWATFKATDVEVYTA